MIGGKAHGTQRPTALGTMLNASTYGMTKYTVIGTTRAALIAIWAANLRKHGNSHKKGKKSSKNPPTYVENVDFFCGTNPIEGALQVWSNNTNRYTLDFIKLDINAPVSGSGLFPWMNHMTIADSNFYFVLAVTIDVSLYGSFSDYGDPALPGGILQYDIAGGGPFGMGGLGYAINDQFSVTGGNGDAVGHVTAISGGGVVTAYVLDSPGSGYTAPAFNTPTITLTGSGSGFEVNIWIVGKQLYGANNTSSAPVVIIPSEHPMWNLAQHGPNIVRPSQMSLYPYVYYWTPACGNLVYFPAYNNVPSYALSYHIYYARLNSSTHHQAPITYNRMHFEPVLAGSNATEYALAGLTSQQDPHPCDAGLGSPDIDLGASALLPDWRVELKGSHPLHAPRGDADFVDMIQDTLMSGQLQVGAQLGLLQRGVNCNDLPGLVQEYFDGTLEPVPVQNLIYAQPNAQGSLILAFFQWRPSGGPDAVVTDTAGDLWTPVFAASYCVFAYATSVGATGNTVIGTSNLSGFAYDSRGFIFEMDPGSNQVIDTDFSQGTGASVGQIVSVTVNVLQPCFLLVAGAVENFFINSIPAHWDDLSVPIYPPAGGSPLLMKRYVSSPGSYTFSLKLSGGYWNLGIVAMAGDPSPLPKTLGDIIDHDSLELTRTQCWANGLIGSICMDSQRTASDWLKDFYLCADAAPVWSGFKLKTIPRSEVSFAGGGVVYVSPTASGPVAIITINDIVDKNQSPIVIKRKGQVDAPGIFQIEHVDRGNDYNVATASEPEPGSNTIFGPRKKAPLKLNEIQDPTVARKINVIEVHRDVYLRNSYNFVLTAKWILLEAMDLIRIPDPNDFATYIDVRLTKVAENDQLELECEADPFIYGLNAPNELTITVVSPNNPDSTVVPASVNTPIIFEPPPQMYQNQNARELWIVVSDSDPNYGGCSVYVSFDGGVSYQNIGVIQGNATTGVLTADWPAAADPDTTNDLLLDLTESNGSLETYTTTEEDAFFFPCYVDSPSPAINLQSGTTYTVVSGDNGKLLQLTNAASVAVTLPAPGSLPSTFSLYVFYGTTTTLGGGTVTITPTSGTINGVASFQLPFNGNYFCLITISGGNYITSINLTPVYMAIYGALFGNASMSYELMTYAVANLTFAFNYTLKATGGGNHLRRAVFGVPAGTSGIDHPIGARFAFLNHISTAQTSSEKGTLLSNGPGIGIYVLPLALIGMKLYFKFPTFNTFGSGVQDLSDATVYTYTPGGIVNAVNPFGISSQLFLVNGT